MPMGESTRSWEINQWQYCQRSMSLPILGTVGNVSLVRLGGMEGLEIALHPAKAQGTQGS